MELKIIGGDGAFPAPGGACNGYVVEHDGFRLLIDPGYAVFPRLTEEVHAVFVTHGHPDHCADLNPLLRARSAVNAPRLKVHALPGALTAVLALDRPGWLDSAYELVEFSADDAFDIGPFSVRTTNLPHFLPNAGVRLTAGGQTMAYTGDTGPSPALPAFAAGVDLLLAEASFADEVPAASAEHLSSAHQAGQLAAEAEVGQLILTHLFPKTDNEAAVRAAADSYSGPIAVAARTRGIPFVV
ncbi:MBL fold metallo-hydrolase [Fodinicola feengrottensis]|uniref:MBL fold metallo-hydrolase n=1 Tax=Fodinicola feengrottensis TaxID=435914 RepID=A0ABN2IA77_9ACTN|nr:MBL fold metallo-hydrolase [Fodinicola feengrottensis]